MCRTKPVFTLVSLKVAWSEKSLIVSNHGVKVTHQVFFHCELESFVENIIILIFKWDSRS